MKKNEDSLSIIKKALLKKAQGFYADEIIEEYAYEDGKEVLLKKKVTKKYVPADLTASKLLLDYFGEKTESFDGLSDTELDKEAIRLVKEYQELAGKEVFGFTDVNSNKWYSDCV